ALFHHLMQQFNDRLVADDLIPADAAAAVGAARGDIPVLDGSQDQPNGGQLVLVAAFHGLFHGCVQLIAEHMHTQTFLMCQGRTLYWKPTLLAIFAAILYLSEIT